MAFLNIAFVLFFFLGGGAENAGRENAGDKYIRLTICIAVDHYTIIVTQRTALRRAATK